MIYRATLLLSLQLTSTCGNIQRMYVYKDIGEVQKLYL